jgi:hypothetical protein
MAGWSVSAMVTGLPALAGLTLDVANHVQDFAIFIAAAIFVRVALEEFAARAFPWRLNRINPDVIPEPPVLQRGIVLLFKYVLWVFAGAALLGPSWQVWVGSALFVFPTVIGWFQDRFPNLPTLWKLLPSGLPGLALTLFVSSATTAIVGAIVGASPELGAWSFMIMPLPLLVLSLLGMFGRYGNTEDDEKPIKNYKWIYRIGGLIMLVITLKLAGVI